MIKKRHYSGEAGITPDYFAIRAFLLESGRRDYTYARWDWMITHPGLVRDSISRIGLWEDDGAVVALATYDCQPDDTYLIVKPEYRALLPEMIEYAESNLCLNDEYCLVIPDDDTEFGAVAAAAGYVATAQKERTAFFDTASTPLSYTLPEGFHLTDMHERFDLYEYGKVLWRGFDHEKNGEGGFLPTPEDEAEGLASMLRPNVDLSLKIAAVAPDGGFAAYCGMWYDRQADFAVVEPVACDPAYRRMGLGRAVVLEGIKRTAAMGARLAAVGSSQRFYYSIGFTPALTATGWKKK